MVKRTQVFHIFQSWFFNKFLTTQYYWICHDFLRLCRNFWFLFLDELLWNECTSIKHQSGVCLWFSSCLCLISQTSECASEKLIPLLFFAAGVWCAFQACTVVTRYVFGVGHWSTGFNWFHIQQGHLLSLTCGSATTYWQLNQPSDKES